jgi:hypothetical protein
MPGSSRLPISLRENFAAKKTAARARGRQLASLGLNIDV